MKGDCFTNREQKDMSNLHTHDNKRSSFSGKLGYVLSAAGASVGLGNIWRFPYLAAKYGGGIFLLIYILLALTFGYTMIMAESALGRMTRKSPVGAFQAFGKAGWLSAGGWINAIIPVLIVPYYSVIGGWVIKYLIEYIRGNGKMLAADGYFSEFISDGGAKRNRTCIEIYDADTDRVIRPDCGVFRDKTGRHGGSKIFSCAKCEKLFLDDGGSGDGTDVLFAVDCNGNPHYLWILYEKRNITGRFHKKCGSV